MAAAGDWTPDGTLRAAVDVGSNSVHLLVGRPAADGVEPLRDESVLLGLGDVVDRDGALPDDARAAVVEALLRLRDAARATGARGITFLATEPLRRATNGPLLVEEVAAATGMPLHVLSERQEAELTWLGVTGGRAVGERLLVVDIGGGSTELVVNADGGLLTHALASGSSRLTRSVVHHDPPTNAEIEALRLAARELTEGLPHATVERAVFVGGTATNLVRLAPLTPEGLVRIYGLVCSLAAQALVETYLVNLRRARQLAGGAAIAEALLDYFAPARVEVSQSSLRDGAILAEARLGDGWLERLAELLPAGERASGRGG